VNAGILPLAAAVASFAAHQAVRSVGQYYLSRSLTACAVATVANSVNRDEVLNCPVLKEQ